MKQGKSLVDLAREIERQAQSKRDFVAPNTQLGVHVEGDGRLALAIRDEPEAQPIVTGIINKVAHRQLGDHLDIPARYYDHMLERDPELLAINVNRWLSVSKDARMVRMLDGNVRAYLSDRFRRDLENWDLMSAVIPPIRALNCEVVACDITETRLYIKAVDKSVIEQMPAGSQWGRGHTIQKMREASPAITISNSEVGMGSLSIESGIYDAFCTNLAFFGGRLVKKQHVGAKHEIVAGYEQMLSDATKQKTNEALWAQISDVIKGAFDHVGFKQRIASLVETQQQKISGDVPKVVELASRSLGLNDTERGSVLRHLIEAGDLSRFGLYNAITRTAEDVLSFDRATELERIGPKLIDLPQREWNEIAAAA